MKTSTLLVLAGAAVILFEMQRQAQGSQTGSGYTPPSSGGGLLSGIASGLGSLFGGGGAGGTGASGGGSSYGYGGTLLYGLY